VYAFLRTRVYSCIGYRGNDSWPTLGGVIEGPPEIRASGREGKNYYALLFYSYSVNAERYSGTWQSPSGVKRQQLIDVIAAKLSSGSTISVRYNPRKPHMSMADIDASIFSLDPIITLGL
jgi:hypothetical protein